MKKKLLLVLFALLTALCLCFGIAACTGGGDPSAQTPQSPSTPSTPSTPSKPSTPSNPSTPSTPSTPSEPDGDKTEEPEEDAEETLADAVARLSRFLEQVKGNYRYTANGKQYDYASDLVKVTDGGTVVYYAQKGGENYIIAKNGDAWERDFCGDGEVWETAKSCLAALRDIAWTAYAEGELQAEGIRLHYTDDAGIAWQVGEDEYALSKVGAVALTLPAYKDVAQYVYETVNGQRKYNIPLLAKTLEETLKADNSSMVKANGGVQIELVRVTHIKSDDEEFGFGSYCSSSLYNSRCYAYFKINVDYTVNKLTPNEFAESLNQKNSLKILDGSNCNRSTEEDDPQFVILAQNVLKKLAKDGCQGNDIRDKADPIPEYANAEILFGYKTKDSTRSAGFYMGDKTTSNYMMLIRYGDTLEEIHAYVAVACSSKGNNYYLENLDTERVLIVEFEREEIDKENAKLYSESVSVSAARMVTLYYEEKRR